MQSGEFIRLPCMAPLQEVDLAKAGRAWEALQHGHIYLFYLHAYAGLLGKLLSRVLQFVVRTDPCIINFKNPAEVE